MEVQIAVITVSDRCSSKQAEDTSGPTLLSMCNNHFEGEGFLVSSYLHLVPDDYSKLKQLIIFLCDEKKMNFIFTTGGTGVSDRDVTPEATRRVIEKEVPGIPLMMISESLKLTKLAALSRAAAGIRGKSVIINFPGSERAVIECFNIVKPTLRHMHCLLNNISVHAEKITNTNLKNDEGERVRVSPYKMVEYESAKSLISEESQFLAAVVEMSVASAVGYVLAEDVYSPCPVPGSDLALKDGYAVAAPVGRGEVLTVGTDCFVINTGLPLKSSHKHESVNAVLAIEDTEKHGDGQIRLLADVSAGESVRFKGSDLNTGTLLTNNNTKITPEVLMLLISAGIANVRVHARPKVGVLSTGDEVYDSSKNSHSSCKFVPDCNRPYMLAELARNHISTVDGGIAPDNYPVLSNKIASLISNGCNIIVSTGSASMGEKDYLKQCIKDLGGEIKFGRVNLKPGKPTSFAVLTKNEAASQKKVLFFVLPGNPVSCYVMFNMFVLDCCLSLICQDENLQLNTTAAKLDKNCTYKLTDEKRPELIRCRSGAKPGRVQVLNEGRQASSTVMSVKDNQMFVLVPSIEQYQREKNTKNSVIDENYELKAFIKKFF